MTRSKHDPTQYHKRDPLSFASGAFKGLTTMLPKGVRVQRSGGTFAVSSAFPWLVFGRAIEDVRPHPHESKSKWLRNIYLDAKSKYNKSPETATLYLPSPSAAGVSTINASAGVAGGLHEAGHIICDRANCPFPSYDDFYRDIGRHLNPKVEYFKCNLPKWVNVCADMRLEPGMSLLYPEVDHRFHSIQTWVHELEKKVRGKDVPSDFMMALRDSGKGWISDESKTVYQQYDESARALVDMLKPIWSVLKPRNTDWDSTAYLPVYVAVEIINALQQLLEEPPKKNKSGGEGGGGGGDGEKQEGESEKGDSGDSSKKDKNDEQGNGAGTAPMSLDEIRRVLQGQGQALDPSSAMTQEVQKNRVKLDHDLYIPNGSKVIYRNLI